MISVLPSVALGQIQSVTREGVTISYENLSDGTIKVANLWNKTAYKVTPKIDGQDLALVTSNSSCQINKIARSSVSFGYPHKSGSVLWKFIAPPKEEVSSIKEKVQNEVSNKIEVSQTPSSQKESKTYISNRRVSKNDNSSVSYLERMNHDEFFGSEAVKLYIEKTDSFVKALSSSSNKRQFVIDHDLNLFLQSSIDEMNHKRDGIQNMAQEMVIASRITNTSSQDQLLSFIIETLTTRLGQREKAYERLNNLVMNVSSEKSQHRPFSYDFVNYILIGSVVLILIIWIIVVASRRKKNKKIKKQAEMDVQSHNDANPAIVVRRRTTSILKKQSLEDVINNSAYMKIETSEFTLDSAIQYIYIKNTCIKEVYNLYAEDLRNADNPKEDGCMVLGRWVLNEFTHTYDISLEDVVLPGDDAVFKEYELNFGGKIKLRIAEKLRKLRRDTNLQYDLTCWIHSHPGLGVFFSNSDSNVQMQLKHSQHPNFLVAFVVDILTSNQELGIFTFRKDGTINSKGDLTRMYSLEDMYKWALDSDRQSFIPENYYNLLENAKVRTALCAGIELNNNAIIDLTQITIEPNTGLVGWAIGFTSDGDKGKEYVVSSIAKDSGKPVTGVLGCLVSVTHMSLPTIQRLIASVGGNVGFVLVYSSKLMTLTSIPLINGEIITDERFYEDINIDDLKIWTRRKR